MKTAILIVLSTLALASTAQAARMEMPVDVGFGPAAHLISGAVFDDQPIHWGLKFSVAAVLDQRTIQRHSNKIPRNYRKMAKGLEEVRITPSIFIPDTLFISPKVKNTGMYGLTWEPIKLSIPLVGKPSSVFRARLTGAVLATVAFVHSDVLPNTLFARPGVGLGLDAQLRITRSFFVSLGWTSGVYVPQELGGFGLGSFEEMSGSMWHIGQGWVKLHVRFPYTVSI